MVGYVKAAVMQLTLQPLAQAYAAIIRGSVTNVASGYEAGT